MRTLTTVLLLLLIGTVGAIGQTTIDQFDSATPDSIYWRAVEGAPSYVRFTQNTADKVDGAASLTYRAAIGAFHQWGSFSQFGVTLRDSVADWSLSDSMSIWYKVTMAPTHPEYMVLRVSISDSTSTGEVEEYIYENTVAVDSLTSGWVNLRIPIFERPSDGTTVPNADGFVYAPTTWGGFTYNNKKLDRDKIMKWSLALVTTGWDPSANLPADSIEVQFDKFERVGVRAVPVILFNGLAWSSVVTNVWAWGQSATSLEEGAGAATGSNAVKWVQGNEWGNGWTGWGCDMAPTNIVGGWAKDSLTFKLKAEAGVGSLRIQFESANGVRGKIFDPITDNAWHTYKFALRDMTFDDGKPNFDSSLVTKFGLMAQASAIAGKVIFITDIWTGNPVFDVIPPVAPTGVFPVGGPFQNLVTWSDISEADAKYNVYFAEHAFTNYKDSTVEDLPPYGIAAGAQLATHVLRSPNADQALTYYYGVNATDAAGNVGPLAVATNSITTTAKGVPTIAKTPPASFMADGSITEWTAAGIRPFPLSVDSGSHNAPNGTWDGSADLSARCWVATDADYLYIAIDVVDDVVAVDTTLDTYLNDSPDLFIGLYDWRGKRHKGYRSASTPDYHLRFCENKIYLDNGGRNLLYAGNSVSGFNPNYRWKRKTLTSGYIVEAKISFVELQAAVAGSALFVPVEGMRIPIDFSINDRDAQASTRDCILCYSPMNDDNSYQDMFRWSFTWIGNKSTATDVEQVDDIVRSFELGQNYPNPFNPTTVVSYQLSVASEVSLRVYDMLGREVDILVNSTQGPGAYTVTFDASKLSTGMYMYRLAAGANVSVKKMMLLK